MLKLLVAGMALGIMFLAGMSLENQRVKLASRGVDLCQIRSVR